MSSKRKRPMNRRELDESISLEDWSLMRKRTLQDKASEYGLRSSGTKETLAERIFNYLHSEDAVSLPEGPSTDEESGDSDPEAPPAHNVFRRAAHATQPPPPTQDVVSIAKEDLRALIREEISATPAFQRPPVEVQSQLSPASSQGEPQNPQAPISAVPTTSSIHPSSAFPPLHPDISTGASNLPEGNLQNLFSANMSALPPLSTKILKAIKDKEYVDFNLLLPNSLYDPASLNQNFNLQFNPNQIVEGSVSWSSTRRHAAKVSDFPTWLEAWNVFIRAMVFYHSELALDLLMYQECISNFARLYSFKHWSKYDNAFRLAMQMNRSLSWARIDEYAFAKFIRSPPAFSPQPPRVITCFKCSNIGHLASNCPNESFRPSFRSPQPSSSWGAEPRSTPTAPKRSFQANNPQDTSTCRYFNTDGCQYKYCIFPHKCNRCQGPHPGRLCHQATGSI